MNGLVAATAARMIAEGKGVRPGVQYLAGSVNPASFLAELRSGGLDLVETCTDGPTSIG